MARLFISPAHGLPVREVSEVRAVPDWGLEGCAHARRGSKRQVLLIDAETLQEMTLDPGQVKENVVTQGLDQRALQRGQRLRLGEALLEITIPCSPCNYIESLRPGLEAAMRGRRGMLARVLEGGVIRTGDAIELIAN
ncbi:MAG TPA: MOSC domain-containing protein [Candidatus Acidoferrales bacterium]|nr:MOSC domain-containing protein [Candidatus Acidoferrales bacterium]